VILLGELDGDMRLANAQAEHVAGKILARLGEPYQLAHADGTKFVQHRCSASVGVAIFDGAEDEENALRRADTAMYCAKASGRNRVSFDVSTSQDDGVEKRRAGGYAQRRVPSGENLVPALFSDPR
jgi:GGDEF domain-containing protein